MKKMLLFGIILMSIITMQSALAVQDQYLFYMSDVRQSGVRAEGTYDINFSITDAVSGGNKLWNFSDYSVNLSQGQGVLVVNYTGNVDFTQDLWIELVVAGTVYDRKPLGNMFNTQSVANIKYVESGNAADLEYKWNNLVAGDELIIPCGNYEIDQELYILKPNITIQGGGIGCTYIKQADDSNLANKSNTRDLGLIQIGINETDGRYETYGITLKDFTLDFNQDGQSNAVYEGRDVEANMTGIGIYVDGTNDILIERVEVIDAHAIGIWLYGTDANSALADIRNAVVRDCIVRDRDGVAEQIGIMTSGNLIFDAMILYNYIDVNATNQPAIRGEELTHGQIIGNIIWNPDGIGIGVYEHSATPSVLDHYVVIDHNILKEKFTSAIQVGVKSNHVTISSNQLIANSTLRGTNGIDVYNSGSASNITDIKILDNTIWSSTRGIYIRNSSTTTGVTYALIEGNSVYDATTGVVIENLNDYNKVINNYFDTSVTTAVSDLGSNNQYYDNIGVTTETSRTYYNLLYVDQDADSQAFRVDSNGAGILINHNDTNSYAFSAVSTGTISATVNAQNRFDCRGASSTKPCLQLDTDSTTASALDLTAATSGKAITMTNGTKICLDGTSCNDFINSSDFYQNNVALSSKYVENATSGVWNISTKGDTASCVVASDGSGDYTDIQSCVDSLTSGRNRVETVYVKGNYTITSPINLTSYTKLDMTQARIRLNNSIDDEMIINSDKANGNTNIIIIGGVLDGNKEGQTTANDIILFDKVSNSRIEGVEIKNSIWAGINLYESSSNNVVVNNIVHSNYGHGILIDGASSGTPARYNIIADNVVYGLTNLSASTGYGIYIYRFGQDNLVDSNVIYNLGAGHGIQVHEGSINNVIYGNNIKNVTGNGINIYEGANYSIISDNMIVDTAWGISVDDTHEVSIQNNMIVSPSNRGIEIDEVTNSQLIGNSVIEGASNGIYIDDVSTNNIISHNIITNSSAQGIQTASSSNQNTISYNELRYNTNGAILIQTDENNIDSNKVFSPTSDGIAVTGNNNTIVSNFVKDCPSASFEGILLTGSASYNLVSSNKAMNNRYGIGEESTADYNIIIGNDVRGNANSGINFVGTNTVVFGNIDETGTYEAESNLDMGQKEVYNVLNVNATEFYDDGTALSSKYVDAGGDTMTGLLTIDQNGDGKAINIDSESTSAEIVYITNDQALTGDAFYLNMLGARTGRVMSLLQNHVNSSGNVLRVYNQGTGDGLFIDQNGDGIGLSIDSESTTTTGINIDVNNGNALTADGDIKITSGHLNLTSSGNVHLNGTNQYIYVNSSGCVVIEAQGSKMAVCP